MEKRSRRQMAEKLRKRIKEGQDRSRGGSGALREDLPDDVKLWRCGTGDHIIDIIPYTAGAFDPLTKEGEETYHVEVNVHSGVGQAEGSIICPAETYRKSCPICEDRRRRQKAGDDEDDIKALQPSRWPRSLYNIICYDSEKEQDKGIQIWEVSNWLMEKYILELAKTPVRPGRKGVEPLIIFCDPDEGKSIAFKREGTGQTDTKYIGHRFLDREDYVISDEALEAAHCLDELLYIPTYDEVYEFYYGESKDGKTEEEVETKLEEEKAEPEKKVEKEQKSSDGTSRRERLRKIRGQKEDKEEKKDKDNPCPSGHEFGVDCSNKPECDDCDEKVWQECAAEAERLEDEKKKEDKGSGRRR